MFSGGASSYDQAIETLVFAKAKGWKRIADGRHRRRHRSGHQRSVPPRASTTQRFSGDQLRGDRALRTRPTSASARSWRDIKAANPDAIFAQTVGIATGTLLRGLRDAGLDDVPFMTNLGNVLNAALNQYSSLIPTKFYSTAPRFYAATSR